MSNRSATPRWDDKTQQRQIDYLRQREPHERLGGSTEYHLTCYTDGASIALKSADVARSWIQKNHWGHKTWIDTVR